MQALGKAHLQQRFVCLCINTSEFSCVESRVGHLRGMHKLCIPCSIPTWLDSSMPMRGPQGAPVSQALMHYRPHFKHYIHASTKSTAHARIFFFNYIFAAEMMRGKSNSFGSWHLLLHQGLGFPGVFGLRTEELTEEDKNASRFSIGVHITHCLSYQFLTKIILWEWTV